MQQSSLGATTAAGCPTSGGGHPPPCKVVQEPPECNGGCSCTASDAEDLPTPFTKDDGNNKNQRKHLLRRRTVPR